MNPNQEKERPKDSTIEDIQKFKADLKKAYKDLDPNGRMTMSNIDAHMKGDDELHVSTDHSNFSLGPIGHFQLTIRDYINWLQGAGFEKVSTVSFQGSQTYVVGVKS